MLLCFNLRFRFPQHKYSKTEHTIHRKNAWILSQNCKNRNAEAGGHFSFSQRLCKRSSCTSTVLLLTNTCGVWCGRPTIKPPQVWNPVILRSWRQRMRLSKDISFFATFNCRQFWERDRKSVWTLWPSSLSLYNQDEFLFALYPIIVRLSTVGKQKRTNSW